MANLTIVDWNICSENKDWNTALAFLFGKEKSSADIVCIQEVPLDIMQRLEKVPGYMVATAEDTYQWSGGEKKICYLVIMSKYALEEIGRFSYGRVLKRLRYILKRSLCAQYKGVEEGREFLYVDISAKCRKLRIFNVHFDALASPWRRLIQWRKIRRHFSKGRHIIVCGDLNIHHGSKVRIFNMIIGWLIFGWAWTDLQIKEREAFEKRFHRTKLISLFGDCVTHPSLWGSQQIDDVLVPRDAHVIDVHVSEKLHGSDHYPLCAIINLDVSGRRK